MTEVLVVSSPTCHLCADALHALAELSLEFPLAVREVGWDSVEGRTITDAHRPGLQPVVLVDGRLFSTGRLPRRKLRAYLERVR